MTVQDLTAQFDSDWQKAQKRYQDYVNVAYPNDDPHFVSKAGAAARAGAENMTLGKLRGKARTDFIEQAVAEAENQARDTVKAKTAAEEAKTATEGDRLFLEPVRSKWKIIQSSPQTFQDRAKLSKISSDFESATQDVSKEAYDRSFSGTPANNLTPLVTKWMTETAIGREVKKTDLAQLQLLKHQRGLAEKERSKYDWALQNAHPQKDEDVEEKTTNFDIRKQGYKSHLAQATSDLEKIDPIIQALVSGKPELAQAGDAMPDAAAAPEVQTPFNRPNRFSPLPDHVPSDLSMVASNPFDEFRQQLPQVAPAPVTAMPARNNGQFFISGQNGKPDLTNYEGGRSEADAAWAARVAPRISPSADTAPVERTAAAVNADNALVAVINPQGKRVRIKQSQLDDALTQGYTEP